MTMPRAGTVTDIYADFEITASATVGLGSNNYVVAELYIAPAGSNVFAPVPSTEMTLLPGQPIASINVLVSGSVDGLTVAVNPGDQLLMVFSGYTADGIAVAAAITGYARAALAIS